MIRLLKMKSLLSVLFALATIVRHAQDDYPDVESKGAFAPGYYYTHTGQKVAGLLRLRYDARFSSKPDNWVVFKQARKAKKAIFSPSDIKAFVIGADSFTVIKTLKSMLWPITRKIL